MNVYMSASKYCILITFLIFHLGRKQKKNGKTEKKKTPYRNCSNIHKYQNTSVKSTM